MASFKDWWLGKLITQMQQDAFMRTLARAVGDVADGLEVRADNAVKQRFPHFTSKGGLAAIGDERGLSRPFGGTDKQYADKLQNAWDIWPRAGTPFGMLLALSDDGYNVEFISKAGRHFTLAPDRQSVLIRDAAPWTFQSGVTSFWNTFALVIRSPYPHGAVPLQTSGEGQAFLATVEKWRFAHARLGEVTWAGAPSNLIWGDFPPGSTWASQGRSTWSSGGVQPTIWTSF